MFHTSAKILELIAEAGLQETTVRRLLQPIGIDPADLRETDRYFTLNEILAIFRSVIAYHDDPELAFRAGHRFSLTHMGVFGLAVMSQSDLRSALDFALKYRPLSSPIIGLDIRSSANECSLVFSPFPGVAADDPLYPRLLDFNIAMFAALITDAIAPEKPVKLVRLSARSDRVTREVLTKHGFTILPDQGEDALVLKPRMIDAALRLKSTTGAAVGQKLCSEALAEMPNLSKFATDVRAAIMANIEKPTTAAFVAHTLGISERSLRRRLAEEQLCFRGIRQAVQADIASRYLRQTQMKVEDVAIATGFSDVANFRRAFRRQHGLTPQEYRRSVR